MISSARITTIILVVSLIFSAASAVGNDEAPADDRLVQHYLRCMTTTKLELHKIDDQSCYIFFKYLPLVKVVPPAYVKALSIVYDNNQTRVDLDLCKTNPDLCSDHTAKLVDAYKHDERVWKFSRKCSIR
ncbi:thioredoxin domain-containing protein 8 [Striga asiatica]|uniref:Thioredoxin domain-containing protein 8 n=1 Tax=Striga asiatica TaxID=4170 RepID=A0A5A7RJN0_STRAF|nr:thioredoxin domain-containing protein 8 [Striga asiatica]